MNKLLAAIAAALLCTVVVGCGTLEPPEETRITEDLNRHYQRMEYELAGESETVTLCPVTSVEVLELEVDRDENTALIRCRVQAVAEGDIFARTDEWELLYTYNKKGNEWEMEDRDCISTEYELLSDLKEELCLQMLSGELGEDRTFVSVTTDRAAKTATAVYTYESVTAVLGSYGSITLNASVDASFRWDSDGGWRYTGSALGDESEYTCDLRCSIGFDGKGMLSVDQFTVGFDLVVIDGLVCIENLDYQGSVCTLGELHIGNARFVALDEGTRAQIVFDFVRDTDGIEQDKNYIDSDEYREFYKPIFGTGTVTISEDEEGALTAELFLPAFIAWHNAVWSDFREDGIELRRIGEQDEPPFPSGTLPEPEPVPSDPPPETDVMSGSERTCAGEWVFTAPAGGSMSGTVEAHLREDGTCSFVCTFDLGTVSRSTTYCVVEDVSQLPTDLIDTLLFGGTPVVCVVYDGQRDVLITCLKKGTYIYLSRAESGGSGGMYQPE